MKRIDGVNKKGLWVILISSAIFLYFLVNSDIRSILDALRNVSVKWVLIGTLFLIFQIWVKALRLRYIAGIGAQHTQAMIGIVGINSLLNNILPAGLGELSIPLLLKKIVNVRYAISTGSLLTIRVVDFSVSALPFALLLFLNLDLLALPGRVSSWILGLGLVCLMMLFGLAGFIYSDRFYRWGKELRFFKRRSIGVKVEQFIQNMREHLRTLSLNSLVILTVTTALLWGSSYIVYLAACRAIQVDLTMMEIFLVFLMIWPISVLPVRGFLNVGSHELGWSVPLMLIGHSEQAAANTAIGTHFVLLLNFLLTSLLLFFFYHNEFLAWLSISEKSKT